MSTPRGTHQKIKHWPAIIKLPRWSIPAGLVLAVVFVTLSMASTAKAIVQGQTVNPAPPWIAVVRSNFFGLEETKCTGSVVASRWILTAAHCVLKSKFDPSNQPFHPIDPTATTELTPTDTVDPSARRVGLGATNASQAPDKYEVKAIHLHPQYLQRVFYETNKDGTPKRVRCADEIFGKNCRIVKAAREYNDAALLELTSAVSSRYQPITLGTAINGSAVAYGYGETDHKKQDGILRRTLDNAYRVEHCDFGPDVLCARTSTSYVAAGDSGGPWLQQQNGVPMQIGISSEGGNTSHHPVNIEHVLPWIAKLVGLHTGGNSHVLIYGSGYIAPLTNLNTILTAAGYQVTTASTLPDDLNGFGSIWYVGIDPISQTDADRLVAYAKAGNGLYLTGERPCCEELNATVAGIVNRLIVSVGGIGIGGLGDPYLETGPLPINPSAAGQAASRPFALTTWQPSAPGGMSNIAAANVFAYVDNGGGDHTAVAATWGADDVTGGGRLAVLMDINWLDPDYWDEHTAYQVAQNLQLFLSGLPNPPAPPVAASIQEAPLVRQQAPTVASTPSQTAATN
jgi:hypothetical protein